MKKLQYLFLTVSLIALASVLFAQTDSSDYYLKKGLVEKTKGRLMESYKALDKAYSFNKKDQQVIAELAKTLFDLRRYAQAKEKYLQLESMGDRSVNTYNQLLTLSFNARQYPDVIK
jgi:tetratricopeptide (TPR) repeat protein